MTIHSILNPNDTSALKQDKEDVNPLHQAVIEGYESTIHALLKTAPHLLNTQNEEGWTPLMIAADKGNVSIVKLLLSHGTHLNQHTYNNCLTALHSASRQGYNEIINLLLSGAKCEFINISHIDGSTPLMEAIKQGHLSTVQLLVKYGADTTRTDSNHSTVLHFTAYYGHEKIIGFLLQKEKTLINTKNFFEKTPLMIAAERGHYLTVKRLLDYGAEIRSEHNSKFSALQLAAAYHHDAVVELLLQTKPTLINDTHLMRITSLMEAAAQSHESTVQLLLNYGADPTLSNDWKYTALHFAAQKNNENVVELLLKAAPHLLEKKGREVGWTPLMEAAHAGHLPVVKLLLDYGADPHISQSHRGVATAVHLAARQGHEKIIALLLQSAPDLLDLKGRFGWTPLMIAAKEEHFSAVKLLLEYGASHVEKSDQEETALYLATCRGNEKIVERLLNTTPCLINTQQHYGWTPLMIATSHGHFNVVQLLLQHGATPNLLNVQKETALHIATVRKFEEIIKVLLTFGAKLNIKDCNTYTPMDYLGKKLKQKVAIFYEELKKDIEQDYGYSYETVKQELKRTVDITPAWLQLSKHPLLRQLIKEPFIFYQFIPKEIEDKIFSYVLEPYEISEQEFNLLRKYFSNPAVKNYHSNKDKPGLKL